MALDTSTSTTDRIDFGSGASLDNLAQFTYAAWAYPTTVTAGNIGVLFQKGLAAAGVWLLLAFDSNNGEMESITVRSTTNCHARSSTNWLTVNTWQFLACTIDTASSTNTDEQLWRGTLTAPPAEPPSYGIQESGSGTTSDNSASNFTVGNRTTNHGREWPGPIAWVGVWNRRLTEGELLAQWMRPHVTSGCVLFSHLGYNKLGTQADWSGNGNNGTVVGPAVADHVPLGSPFGFTEGESYAVAIAAAVQHRMMLLGVGR